MGQAWSTAKSTASLWRDVVDYLPGAPRGQQIEIGARYRIRCSRGVVCGTVVNVLPDGVRVADALLSRAGNERLEVFDFLEIRGYDLFWEWLYQ